MNNNCIIYQLVVLNYPKGSQEPGWEPANWDKISAELGHEDFTWPRSNLVYKSRSAAINRKKLLESYGATVKLYAAEPDWKDEELLKISIAQRKLDQRRSDYAYKNLPF